LDIISHSLFSKLYLPLLLHLTQGLDLVRGFSCFAKTLAFEETLMFLWNIGNLVSLSVEIENLLNLMVVLALLALN
jgi:hypothetical protein